ncbi:MAG: c-type cytochrome, partial [Parvibaculales bacterium]
METLSSLKLWQKIVLSSAVLGLLLLAYGIWYLQTRNAREPSKLAFQEHCASCHGVDLKGGLNAPSLIDRPLSIIDDYQILINAMRGGGDVPPSHDWREALSPQMLKAIALHINER